MAKEEWFFSITSEGRELLEKHGYQEATNGWFWIWQKFGKVRDRELLFSKEDNGSVGMSLVSVTDPNLEDPKTLNKPRWIMEQVLPLIKVETEDYEKLVKDLVNSLDKKELDLSAKIYKYIMKEATRPTRFESWNTYSQKEMVDNLGYIGMVEDHWRYLYLYIQKIMKEGTNG